MSISDHQLRYWVTVLVLWTVTASGAPSISQERVGDGRRPNIILIMTDDQGYGDLGCHGNNTIKTPHLDRLASESVEFTRFYCCPVCSPTRAGLLTGRYCYRTGVWATWQGGETMRLDEITMAELLRADGYRTAIFGKWHLGEVYPWLPTRQGFEDGLYARTSGVGYFDTILERNLKAVPTKGYLTDVLTDAAIEYIEQHRKEPFFVYLPYPSPHKPHQAPTHLRKLYRDMNLDEGLAEIYGMITSIDHNVGRLLDKLEQLELAGNTVVLFLSDNGMGGPIRYNCGLRGQKGQVFEGGIRVPFFTRWTGRWPAGKRIAYPASHIDVLPTVMDICGLGKSRNIKLDGISLMPLLAGKAEDLPDRMLFFHCQNRRVPKPYPNGAVRTRRYKMVNGNQLYDLVADPAEKNDVAGEHPEMLSGLRERYDNWWNQVTTERGLVMPVLPVGHPQENPSILLAWHAICHGDIKLVGSYSGRGDRFIAFLTRWINLDDYPTWNIDVVRSGRYRITACCRCPKTDEGAEIRITVGDKSTNTRLADLQPRVHDGTWAEHPLGIIELKEGKNILTLKALSKTGRTVMEIERLLVERLD